MPRQRVNAPGPTPESEVPMPDQPIALCGCGCGEPAPIAKRTSAKRGVRVGDVLPYRHGHNPSPSKPLRERFDEKVDKNDPNGCWLWTACRNPDTGYGEIAIGGQRSRVAHRVGYELYVGPVPEGLILDHLCRVKHCVNPAHLEPVTYKENLRRGLQGALKETCAKGHPWTPENVRQNARQKECRICAAENKRRARAAARAA